MTTPINRTLRRRHNWWNVALCLVRNDRDEVLLYRRPSHSDYYAGFWGLPGGKFGFSETGIETVKREVREETGVLESQLSLPTFVGLGLERLEQRVSKGRAFKLMARWQLYYFSTRVRGTPDVKSMCRWFSFNELIAESEVIPSVTQVVQIDGDRSQGKCDFFFMEDTIQASRHRLTLSSLRVDTYRRQTSVGGP